MQITINIPADKQAEVLALLNGPAPKATKAAKAAAIVEDEDIEIDDEEIEDDDAPKATLKAVNTAMKKYAADNGREAAGKLLKKFKVKSTEDLDSKDYARIIKAANEDV